MSTSGILNPNYRKNVLVIALAVTAFSLSAAFAGEAPTPPSTDKAPVTDQYHGVDVTDDYRWLENWDDPAVPKWSDAQNDYTRSILDSIPERGAIRDYLAEIMGGESVDYYGLKYRNGVLFAYKWQPPKEQELLITLKSPDDPSSEHIILDVNELDAEGTTSIDFYVPSLDAKLIAVSISEFGSELGTVHVYDVATGKELGDLIPRVNGPTAGGDVAWNADGSGFYYSRYPAPGERPDEELLFYQQVYYHKLGTPLEEDKYAIGKEFPHIAEIQLESSPDGQFILATVANCDGGEYAHYLLAPSGQWTQVTHFEDLIPTVTFGPDNSMYLLSNKGTPRGRIISLAAGETDLSKASVLVEESEVSIRSFVATPSFLYVVDLDGGPSQMRVVNLDDKQQKDVPVGSMVSVRGLTRMNGDIILLRRSSYTEPPAWYRFDPEQWQATSTALFKSSPVKFDDIEIVREFAVSKDGTRVPINIMRPRGVKLDGTNPTLLYGYGGYGISMTPGFSAKHRLWFDQGGIYAVANLRGGGEYGEEWHLAGNLTKKQNVFDDFAACAQHLIDTGYTNPAKLAIQGGSNGGLLMGAAFTQHPDLFGAVVSSVGIYDMVRVELDPNGVFNITEFGTVTNPDHFKAIHAYSPYHNVTEGTPYPPILFLTGQHDGRVNPGQSRKMTARMQVASNSGKPILLRTSAKSGHGSGGLSQSIERQADIYAFILKELNMPFHHDK